MSVQPAYSVSPKPLHEVAVTVALEGAESVRHADYADLFSRSDATAFQAPVWISGVYAHISAVMQRPPFVLTVRAASNNQLLVAVPLSERRHYGARCLSIPDDAVVDYMVPLIDPAFRAELIGRDDIRSRILQAIKGFDLLLITKVPQHALDDFTLVFGELGVVELACRRSVLDVGSNHSAWRAAHMPKWLGKDIDKKTRQLTKRLAAPTWRHLTDRTEIAEAMAEFTRFRATRFQDKGAPDPYSDPGRFDFYQAMAAAAADDPAIRVDVMTVGGAIAGVHLAVRKDGVHTLILTGFDFEQFGRYSPGRLHMDHQIKTAIDCGDTRFDMSIGTEGYKADWHVRFEPMHLVFRSLTPLGLLIGQGVATKNAMKRSIKHLLGRLPEQRPEYTAPGDA
jgi:CelD/BcsL family acetyltransferase involved in cellulose biosynthesis